MQLCSNILLPDCTTSSCNPAITRSVQYFSCSNLRTLKCRNHTIKPLPQINFGQQSRSCTRQKLQQALRQLQILTELKSQTHPPLPKAFTIAGVLKTKSFPLPNFVSFSLHVKPHHLNILFLVLSPMITLQRAEKS